MSWCELCYVYTPKATFVAIDTIATTLTGYGVSAVVAEDVSGTSNEEGLTRKFPVIETD